MDAFQFKHWKQAWLDGFQYQDNIKLWCKCYTYAEFVYRDSMQLDK